MWHFVISIEAIPKDRDLILAVADQDGLHALAFPCRYSDGFWINITTGHTVEVHPTHWREWLRD
jgi:hypothetical protein